MTVHNWDITIANTSIILKYVFKYHWNEEYSNDLTLHQNMNHEIFWQESEEMVKRPLIKNEINFSTWAALTRALVVASFYSTETQTYYNFHHNSSHQECVAKLTMLLFSLTTAMFAFVEQFFLFYFPQFAVICWAAGMDQVIQYLSQWGHAFSQ